MQAWRRALPKNARVIDKKRRALTETSALQSKREGPGPSRHSPCALGYGTETVVLSPEALSVNVPAAVLTA